MGGRGHALRCSGGRQRARRHGRSDGKFQELLQRVLNNQPPATTARASVLTPTESQANHITDETESLKKRVAAIRESRLVTALICCVDDIAILTTTPTAD